MRVLDSIDQLVLDELARRDEFVWLDLVRPSDAQLDALARDLGWHPLALEDTKEFRQRPKLDRYGDHMLLVFYGAAAHDGDRPRLVEVHMVVSGDWVITVRRRACPELDDLRARLRAAGDGGAAGSAGEQSDEFVVYRILDALTDTFFPVLERIDDAIDRIEDAIVSQPTDEQLQRVFQLKRGLGTLRRVVAPQRDLAARAIDEIEELPGLSVGTRDYFRDVYDHLIRVADQLDAYRDLLTGAMDVYLSTQSNRLNAVMKRLTLVSTIFLPITALTGFFGMNFGWLVGEISAPWAFWTLGVGGAVLSVALLMTWFKRARFLD